MSQEIKRVLVAGATGNIGKPLCAALSKKGYDVSIITRGSGMMPQLKSMLQSMDKSHQARVEYYCKKREENEVASPKEAKLVTPPWIQSLNKSTKNWSPAGFILSFLGEKEDQGFTKYSWDDITKHGLPSRTDAIINLSGQAIAKPGIFTNNLKRNIYESRIKTNNTICKAIREAENPPKVFLSASAVGIYDVSTDVEYTEEMVPNEEGKETYITNLCNDWEKSSQLPETIPTRVANLRFGVNLAHNTFPMNHIMLPTFVRGKGGIVGSGKQPFPWVHIEDSVGVTILVLEEEKISGAVNVVAPSIDDNEEFTNQLAAAVKMPEQNLPVQPHLVNVLYGTERAPLLLEGQKVVPQKVLDYGYQFKYPTLVSALKEIVGSYGGFTEAQIDRIFKETE